MNKRTFHTIINRISVDLTKQEQFIIKNSQFSVFSSFVRATILFFSLDFSAAVRILWGETPVKTASKTGVKIKSYRRKTTFSPKKVYFCACIFFWNCAHLKPSSVDLLLSYIFQKNQKHWPKTLAQKSTSHSSNPRYRYIRLQSFPGFLCFFAPRDLFSARDPNRAF